MHINGVQQIKLNTSYFSISNTRSSCQYNIRGETYYFFRMFFTLPSEASNILFAGRRFFTVSSVSGTVESSRSFTSTNKDPSPPRPMRRLPSTYVVSRLGPIPFSSSSFDALFGFTTRRITIDVKRALSRSPSPPLPLLIKPYLS